MIVRDQPMSAKSQLLVRLALLGLAALFFLVDGGTAWAQSNACRELASQMSALDAVRQAESTYVRDGCNDAAKRGERLNAQCRGEANDVLGARARLQQYGLTSNDREDVLQNMARFDCSNSRSRATVIQRNRGSLFDRLFGGAEQDQGDNSDDNFDGTQTRGDEFQGEQGYQTIRTVCVRKSDGFYWPISYSTVLEYAQQDYTQCLAQCPGADVDLYYYNNPGQEPEQMVNLQGQAYSALPSAFAYRTKIDPANSCKPASTTGSVNVTAQADGTDRVMVTYGDLNFPLPMRDPRASGDQKVIQVAAVTNTPQVSVPLPRPRPAAPGEAPKPVAVQAKPTATTNDPERIVMFGDKRVRVVGPDTPYAQPTAAAS